jgi:hypothetical protein
MSGRLLVSSLLVMSLIVGGLTYYYQNYAYYSPVSLQSPSAPAQPQIAVTSENDVVISGADADSETPIVVPGVLDTPTDQGEPAVDTATLDKPDTGTAAPSSDTPNETSAVATPVPTVDGTTPTDPDGATATPLAEVADNIRLAALNGITQIRLTRVWDNKPEVILAEDFEGIDAPTSPLKFKGCFKVTNSIPMMTETYVVYHDPAPIKAPVWFQCYRHQDLTDDLASGEAVAFLGEANIFFGVDRVVAVYGDGRAYVWHQINACGEAAYAGNELPAGCPPKPER